MLVCVCHRVTLRLKVLWFQILVYDRTTNKGIAVWLTTWNYVMQAFACETLLTNPIDNDSMLSLVLVSVLLVV